MLYETVFDISDVGFKYLWLSAIGAIVAVVGMLFLFRGSSAVRHHVPYLVMLDGCEF
jgi:hypothetical protein